MTRTTDIGDVNTAIIKHAHLEITSVDLGNVVDAYVAARLNEERERIAQAIEERIPEPGPGPRTYNREWLSGLRAGMSRAASIARGEAVSGE